MPGLWFSAAELYALLATQKLLVDLEPNLLAAHIAPLQLRLATLLGESGYAADEIAARVRLLSSAKRKMNPQFFGEVTQSLLARQQLQITAWNRGRDEVQTRIVSPQRLVHLPRQLVSGCVLPFTLRAAQFFAGYIAGGESLVGTRTGDG